MALLLKSIGMMRRFTAIFLFILCIKAVASADIVRLIVWQPTKEHHNIVLPQREGQGLEDTITEYLARLAEAGYGGIALSGPHPVGSVTPLPSDSDEFRALLVANEPGDLHPPVPLWKNLLHKILSDRSTYWRSAYRTSRFVRHLSRAEASPYVLGLQADIGLDASQREQFHKLVSANPEGDK